MAKPKKSVKSPTKLAKKPAAKASAKPKKRPGATDTLGASIAAKLDAKLLTVTATDAERAGWRAAAATLADAEVGLSLPFAVLMGEAVDVARFARTRWSTLLDAKTGAVIRPGLASAVRADLKVEPFAPVPVLHAGTAQEILVLQVLAQEAQTRALLSVTATNGAAHPRFEAERLLSDLRGAAESYLDDGVETDEDAQLRAMDKAHGRSPSSDDALAAALGDYAALVETLRPGIDGYADFDADWVARARELAAALRASPASSTPTARADRALLDERDRLGTLLLRRMRLVRAKARFVFRNHPEVVREVTSLYERRRRAASKRAKKAAGETPARPDA